MSDKELLESEEDKCFCCPECGCFDAINRDNEDKGYRICMKCGQEWWIDINYDKKKLK